MEVDVPNGGEDVSSKSISELKKSNSCEKENTKLCNGNTGPVNGQNGNHTDEAEPMDTNEDSNSISVASDVGGDDEPQIISDSENSNVPDGENSNQKSKTADENGKDGKNERSDCDESVKAIESPGEQKEKDSESVKDKEDLEDDKVDEESKKESEKDEEKMDEYVEKMDEDVEKKDEDKKDEDEEKNDNEKKSKGSEKEDEEKKEETSTKDRENGSEKSSSKSNQHSSDIQSIEGDSKPATPSTLVSEESKPATPSIESKPATPSDKSKEPSVDRESSENIPLTEEEKARAKDVDQREEKLKRIENSAKDKEDLRPVAKLLFGIGVDLAAQHIYKDLVRAQNKKNSQKMLDSRGQEQLDKLKDTHKKLSQRNKSYVLKPRGCGRCGFKTESDNVFEWHMEFAHGQEVGKYECSFCDFETRLPAPFFFHMEEKHARKGRVFMKKALFSCQQCPYENNSKHAVTKHRLKCDKQFSLKRNQEPLPTDCDIPLKKPKTLISKQPQRAFQKTQGTAVSNQVKNYLENKQIKNYIDPKKPNQLGRPSGGTIIPGRVNQNATVQSILSAQGRGMNQSLNQQNPRLLSPAANRPTQQLQMPSGQMYTLLNTNPMMIQQNLQTFISGMRPPNQQQSASQYNPPTQNISSIAQQVVAQVTQQHSASSQQQQKAIQEILKRAGQTASPAQNTQKPTGGNAGRPLGSGRAGTLTEAQAQAVAANNPKFEICEICGGFVKDRESLRIHFYWAHKVDIQKDVFARLNPHLKCDSCPQAFWTYQGLARHRQISHAKSKERSYRCYLCGAKNIENIITHLSTAHNVKLNTMYKTGKCLVCGLGFAGEKGLKRHIHTAHMELLKGQPELIEPDDSPKPVVGQKPAAAKDGANPVPTGLFENASKKKKFEPVCSLCNIVFPSVESFTQHCNKLHVFKCHRCSEKWASKDLLQKHWNDKHRREMEPCPICLEDITIGRPFVRHVKSSHMKECEVSVLRMKPKVAKHHLELYRRGKAYAAKPKPLPKPAQQKEEAIIILSDDEDDDKKKSPESSDAASNGKSKSPEKILEAGGKEVLEVDGEKIVVEISEDVEDDDKGSDSDSPKEKS